MNDQQEFETVISNHTISRSVGNSGIQEDHDLSTSRSNGPNRFTSKYSVQLRPTESLSQSPLIIEADNMERCSRSNLYIFTLAGKEVAWVSSYEAMYIIKL
ncbi:hypothetical protein [Vibrio phage vB_VpaP_SJSY21]|nr:hypothetical protein [Vibrio phage vB_VpaP_SJSY21]